jgi:diaminohydroxyphosphoribosylaminopyrimidine deaminase/5-amino-6-(5-phosphoribosylamino)uracil reductase
VDDTTDADLMRRAIALASGGWGRVHPNPMVGALVVRDGGVIGQGWHAEYGGPHAEVNALADAGENARGATLYVSLEPCAHHGKTPPCTEAILAAGIARVVYGARDPNPAAGGGGDFLARQGVDVTAGVEERSARGADPAFFHAHRTGTTWVGLKLAVSLDARIAEHADAPTRITGVRANAEVQRLRAGFDAIMIGIGTALADDPLLTVRGDVRPRRPPIRICLDSEARLPVNGRLARSVADAPVWVVTTEAAPADRGSALERAGVRVLVATSSAGQVDIDDALALLWNGGVRSVLCEGGGRIAASLVEADRLERMYLFQAPLLLGPDAVHAFPLRRKVDRGDWSIHEARRIGDDVLVVADRARPTGD